MTTFSSLEFLNDKNVVSNLKTKNTSQKYLHYYCKMLLRLTFYLLPLHFKMLFNSLLLLAKV